VANEGIGKGLIGPSEAARQAGALQGVDLGTVGVKGIEEGLVKGATNEASSEAKRRQAAADQSAAGPAHSKELTLGRSE
jgi:hypothetical protein